MNTSVEQNVQQLVKAIPRSHGMWGKLGRECSKLGKCPEGTIWSGPTGPFLLYPLFMCVRMGRDWVRDTESNCTLLSNLCCNTLNTIFLPSHHPIKKKKNSIRSMLKNCLFAFHTMCGTEVLNGSESCHPIYLWNKYGIYWFMELYNG